jgi:hypothetical protein
MATRSPVPSRSGSLFPPRDEMGGGADSERDRDQGATPPLGRYVSRLRLGFRSPPGHQHGVMDRGFDALGCGG